jgi:hypothetical protein
MSGSEAQDRADVPWPQQLLESPWLLAGAALLFFTLSYIIWGLVDLMAIAGG